MRCLLLVDVQNDFLPGGALPVPDGGLVVPIANQVQPLFDLVVATQDWQPPDHRLFAANHPGKQPGEAVELDGREQVVLPPHCVQQTPGADFAAELDRSRWAGVFQHGSDPAAAGHSGFFDDGRSRETGLAALLREKQADDLYLLGLPTELGVRRTALDAVRLGFHVWLVADGCRGLNLHPTHVDLAIDEMRSRGIQFITSASMASMRR